MKKSHAALMIAECLIDPHYPDDTIKEAEYILNKLIKCGIEAPQIVNPDLEGEYKDHWDWVDSGVHYPNHVDHGKEYYIRVWEK